MVLNLNGNGLQRETKRADSALPTEQRGSNVVGMKIAPQSYQGTALHTTAPPVVMTVPAHEDPLHSHANEDVDEETVTQGCPRTPSSPKPSPGVMSVSAPATVLMPFSQGDAIPSNQPMYWEGENMSLLNGARDFFRIQMDKEIKEKMKLHHTMSELKAKCELLEKANKSLTDQLVSVRRTAAKHWICAKNFKTALQEFVSKKELRRLSAPNMRQASLPAIMRDWRECINCGHKPDMGRSPLETGTESKKRIREDDDFPSPASQRPRREEASPGELANDVPHQVVDGQVPLNQEIEGRLDGEEERGRAESVQSAEMTGPEGLEPPIDHEGAESPGPHPGEVETELRSSEASPIPGHEDHIGEEATDKGPVSGEIIKAEHKDGFLPIINFEDISRVVAAELGLNLAPLGELSGNITVEEKSRDVPAPLNGQLAAMMTDYSVDGSSAVTLETDDNSLNILLEDTGLVAGSEDAPENPSLEEETPECGSLGTSDEVPLILGNVKQEVTPIGEAVGCTEQEDGVEVVGYVYASKFLQIKEK